MLNHNSPRAGRRGVLCYVSLAGLPGGPNYVQWGTYYCKSRARDEERERQHYSFGPLIIPTDEYSAPLLRHKLEIIVSTNKCHMLSWKCKLARNWGFFGLPNSRASPIGCFFTFEICFYRWKWNLPLQVKPTWIILHNFRPNTKDHNWSFV